MACRICKKPYVPPTDDSSLSFDDKPHLCKICGKSFSLKVQLKRHIESHETNASYICNACEKLTQSSYNLRLSKKGNFVCETCDKCFSTKRLLLRHAGEHTIESISNCDECGETFKNMTALKKHVAIHKPNKSNVKNNVGNNSNEKSYQCQECGKIYVRFNQYEAHCLNHKKYSCIQCNVYFASYQLLKEHLDSSSCQSRTERFSSSNSDNVNCEGKKHECTVCNKSFARKSALEGHIITHFMDDQESSSEDDSDKDIDFQLKDTNKFDLCLPKIKIKHSFPCEKCNLVFPSKVSLNNHMPSHKENPEKESEITSELKKVHTCRICGETFDIKEDYKQHKLLHGTNESNISSVNKEGKSYTCQICNKSFARKKHLKKHLKTHFSNSISESNLSKTSVDDNITDKSNSQDGIKIVSSKKEKKSKNYTCGYCGKLFAGMTCWKKHEAKHSDNADKDNTANSHKKGKKPAKLLICEFCNEDFTGKRHIFLKHKLSHTPEVCGICDARFTDRASLREHCRIHIGTEEGRRFLECSQRVLDAKNGSAQPEPKVEYIYLVLR